MVQRIALHLDLKGWVRNIPDGRVEVLVKGPKEKIEDFCQDVEEYFSGHIKNREIDSDLASSEEFKGFQIVI